MFGPAPQHGGTQQGTCCFYEHSARIFGSRPKNLSLVRIYPLSAALHQDRRRILELLNVCNFAVALGTVLVPSTSTCCRSGCLTFSSA